MDVEKLLICTMNSFEATTVVNIRIIDVKTSYLDFTENVYLKDKNQVFAALQDLVIQMELNYIEKYKSSDTISVKDKVYQTWIRVGAEESVAKELSAMKMPPTEFLAMRQYDISFTPKDYLTVLQANFDLKKLQLFFKEGISFHEIRKAFNLGIADIDNYKNNF